MANKIDSNDTGLRFAVESSIGTLGASPTWHLLEPNSYGDFGGENTLVARNPINSGRQRKKGVITDLDASASFPFDLTQELAQGDRKALLESFFFATTDYKAQVDMEDETVDGTSDEYEKTDAFTDYYVGDLVWAANFTNSENNGLKEVTSLVTTDDGIGVAETLVQEDYPPAGATLERVGFKFTANDAAIDASGTLPKLTASAKDLTELGLTVGDWVWIGGDATSEQFSTSDGVNNTWARVKSIAAGEIEFDKTDATMVTEALAGGETLKIFWGRTLRNKTGANISRTTLQLERTLGEDSNGTMSQYLKGAVAGELSFNVPTAEKVTWDVSFTAIDEELRDGSTGVKSGSRPSLETEDAFNTSSDFSRIKMHVLNASDSNPSGLFAYVTELTFTINNNLSPNKAVSVLGAFDISAGTFEVGGSVTAYFSDVAALEAIRNNDDVSIDWAIVKNNAGMVWDIPLLALGGGILNVEQDQPITVPLEMSAAENTNGYTCQVNVFPYLPTLAE